MSEKSSNDVFFDRADEIIAVANKQIKEANVPRVSASTQYAAARFNAFSAADYANDLEDLKNNRSNAIEFYTEKYREYFTEHLDDYIENYEKYTSE
ncbi:MAG: DUF3144 domain-containing protein [Marinicella sp.]